MANRKWFRTAYQQPLSPRLRGEGIFELECFQQSTSIVQFHAVVNPCGTQEWAEVTRPADRRDRECVLSGDKGTGRNAVCEHRIVPAVGSDGNAPRIRLA